MDKKIVYTDFGKCSYLSHLIDYASNKVFVNNKLKNKLTKNPLFLISLLNQ